MPKRSNYLINKRFQFKYTLSTMMVLAAVMVTAGIGIYFGMLGSIAENFSEFKVSENLENAKRIADYEGARYQKGDYRLDRIFREAQLLSERQQGALKNGLEAVNRSLLPKVAVLAVILFAAGIIISHKIAGPMYRIERSADAIRGGDLSVNFKIRKSDEMKEASSALDGMVESLNSDFKKMKRSCRDLKDGISSAERGLGREDAAKLKDIVSGIDKILAKYKT